MTAKDRLGEWLYHANHIQTGEEFQKGCWVCELPDSHKSKSGTGQRGRPKKLVSDCKNK